MSSYTFAKPLLARDRPPNPKISKRSQKRFKRSLKNVGGRLGPSCGGLQTEVSSRSYFAASSLGRPNLYREASLGAMPEATIAFLIAAQSAGGKHGD
eukprot:1971883-Amphidinium_carterae.1